MKSSIDKCEQQVNQSLLLAVLAICFSCAGCLDVPSHMDEMDSDSSQEEGCLLCHHLEDTDQSTCDDCHQAEGTTPTHQNHLYAEHFGLPVDCSSCHTVPTSRFEEGHLSATVDIIFNSSELSSANGAVPTWDGIRCKNVYCHGSTLSGGIYTEPAWIGEVENGIICGDCHSIPPPPPHPSENTCSSCHPSTYTDGGVLDLDVHLNGKVDSIIF